MSLRMMNNLQQFFPVTLAATWLEQAPSGLSLHLSDWLYDASSLTARLKKHATHFSVEVIGQRVEVCSADEAIGAVKAGEEVLVREVLLYCDGHAQVFARSLLPLSSLTGEQQQLAQLGNQPLGQVLFNHPDLVRHSQQVAKFGADTNVVKLAKQIQGSTRSTSQTELWGRRSMFMVADKPILVAEVFLPGAFAYSAGANMNAPDSCGMEQVLCHD